ncbi:MAG: IclR family transcriptional regulator [Proteobacteria bacterium]|nr:IclR family transcriptional regulator [Pseudomonadota bacterium]
MNDKYSVKVLEKTVTILNLYSDRENAFTLTEIKRMTGFPKTTVFRILKTFENAGFFKYDLANEKYSLGLKFLELGGIVYESLSIRKAAAPHMDALAQNLKAIILLGVIKNDQLLYIDKNESNSIIRVSSRTGLKRPPYFGMLGMTLVAYMDEDERKRLLKQYPPTKITEFTVTDIDEIMRKLDETRRLGYYIEKDEIVEGLLGIGVPIRDYYGNVVAALGATQPAFQIKEGAIEDIIQELLKASRLISKELGHVE